MNQNDVQENEENDFDIPEEIMEEINKNEKEKNENKNIKDNNANVNKNDLWWIKNYNNDELFDWSEQFFFLIFICIIYFDII